MHEIANILLTISFGALGYFLANFWMAPVIRFRALKERIHADLVFYANVLHNPQSEPDDLSDRTTQELRRNASELFALDSVMISLKTFRSLMRIPKTEKIEEAASSLVWMSNSVVKQGSNGSAEKLYLLDRMKKIQDNLGIMFDKDLNAALERAVKLHYGAK